MLINSVAYRHGHKLTDVPLTEVASYLSQPDCFVWIALKDATAAEVDFITETFQLPKLAAEDIRKGHQRPKIEEYGSSLFAVLQLPELIEQDLSVGEVNIFVGKNFILSIRNRSSHDFLGVRVRCEEEPEFLMQGTGFVFYALLDAVADRYFPVLETLELELEAIEEQIFSKGHGRSNIERMYELKRQLGLLKHAVAPYMDAVGKLYGGRVPAICQDLQNYFRDVYDHLNRINSSIDSSRETLSTAMQVNLALVTIEESEVNKRLAAWAGIFAVATFFVGVWGMNFKHMPELDWEYGYAMALVVISVTCGLMYWRFKKSGWL